MGYHAVYENKAPEWMSFCVAIRPSGRMMSGVYDGYGRVRVYQDAEGLVLSHIGLPESEARPVHDDEGWFDVRHQACSHYDKFGHRSEHARCQGWFFEEDMFAKVPYSLEVDEYMELVYDCISDSPYLSDFEQIIDLELVSTLVSYYISDRMPVEWFVDDIEKLIVDSYHPHERDFYRDVFVEGIQAVLKNLGKASGVPCVS